MAKAIRQKTGCRGRITVKYKILIVDDEKMIRMGIKNAMPWERMDISEVYTAASAKEAAAVIEEHQPEIMITDISMTEMSGLELVGEIRKRDEGMRIIVLTGYDRFEYAREALQLRVHDFLLKPIDEKELKRSIEKQVGELEAIRRRREESQTVSRTKGVRQQMELERFMRLLISAKPEAKENLPAFLEEFHFDGERDMRTGLLIPQVHGEEDSESRNFRMQTIRQICLGMVDGLKRGITFTDEKGRIVIAFFCDKEKKEEELSRQLVEILNDEREAKPRIIWGSVKGGIENLSISYNDAVFALEHEREAFEKLYTMDLNRKREDIFQEVFREFRMAMTGSIGEREKMFHIFDRFGMAVDSYNLSSGYTRSCCFELASAVYFAWFTDTGSSAEEHLSALMKSLAGAEREKALKVTEMFLDRLFAGEEGEVHELVGKVKRRVHENLAEDLTVASLAGEFYVTPNYLSRLFKRVTGEGCNEYIVRKRIEKARSLLETTTLKAGEIAMMVGYHDMNYFSLAFKKHTGMSPIKYREQAQGR